MPSTIPILPVHPPIPTVVIEDSPNVRTLICNHLEKHFSGHITIIGEGDRVDRSALMIRKLRPELVLLDIELLDGTGFEILDLLSDIRSTFTVSIITTYEKYIRKGLEYGAVSFIDKPILVPEFIHGITLALKNVLERQAIKQRWIQEAKIQLQAELTTPLPDEIDSTAAIIHNSSADSPIKANNITIKKRDGTTEIVTIDEIIYCLADGSYTSVYCINDIQHIDSKPLKRYEGLLSVRGFIRISRAMLVNPRHCKFLPVGNADFLIILPDTTQLYAEGKYKDRIAPQLQIYEQVILPQFSQE